MRQDVKAARMLGCFRLMLSGVPLLAIVIGVVLVVAGIMQAPRDNAAAAVFRNDPGCRTDLAHGGTAAGACRIVDVRILDASMRSAGSLRNGATTPYVALVLPDGSRRKFALAEDGGTQFARAVYPDTRGRALLFNGEVVRVAAGGLEADAQSAPMRMVRSDAALPWVGAGIIAFGVVFFVLTRRMLATRPVPGSRR